MLDLAAGGRRLVCDWAGGLARSGDDGGTRPRFSGDQPRQAAEDEVEDRLIGRAGRQMDLDLGFHLDDAGGDLDQPQPQRVELGDPPGRGWASVRAGSTAARRRGRAGTAGTGWRWLWGTRCGRRR